MPHRQDIDGDDEEPRVPVARVTDRTTVTIQLTLFGAILSGTVWLSLQMADIKATIKNGWSMDEQREYNRRLQERNLITAKPLAVPDVDEIRRNLRSRE